MRVPPRRTLPLWAAELAALIRPALMPYRVQVWLFGSWARGTAFSGSDVDLAVLPLEPVPLGWLAELRYRLEESTFPYRVDLVDLSQTDPAFRERVLQEGVLLLDSEEKAP